MKIFKTFTFITMLTSISSQPQQVDAIGPSTAVSIGTKVVTTIPEIIKYFKEISNTELDYKHEYDLEKKVVLIANKKTSINPCEYVLKVKDERSNKHELCSIWSNYPRIICEEWSKDGFEPKECNGNCCYGSEYEESGGLCYPKCKEGYTGVGPVCWQNCPIGFKDHLGFACTKPEPYGRGAGYPWKFGDGFNNYGMLKRCSWDHGKCEMWGAIAYPVCRENYHNVGCCVCSPDCPSNMLSDGGAFCNKRSYGRGVGKLRNKHDQQPDTCRRIPSNMNEIKRWTKLTFYASDNFCKDKIIDKLYGAFNNHNDLTFKNIVNALEQFSIDECVIEKEAKINDKHFIVSLPEGIGNNPSAMSGYCSVFLSTELIHRVHHKEIKTKGIKDEL